MSSILTINVGSSSVKVALFEAAAGLPQRAAAAVARVGSPDATLSVRPVEGSEPPTERRVGGGTHVSAVLEAIDAVLGRNGDVVALAHRIVHGGPVHAPCWVDDALVSALHRLAPLASEHLPPALEVLAATTARLPGVRQVACFDTAFHAHLPDLARMYPLPRRFEEAGVRRYGFHGLSCESIMATLRTMSPREADGRVVIAHLGSGASLTAIERGRSAETTMGFSPAGGVMMGTRTGDLDPGVLLYVMEHEQFDVARARRLVTRESGLAGVSGRSADMRSLLAASATDRAARDAIRLFCYSSRKALGSLIAVLGGIDTLVFTGGIGEHAPAVRHGIVERLERLGIQVDERRNAASTDIISPDGADVTVRVIHSDEERVLAEHASSLLYEAVS